MRRRSWLQAGVVYSAFAVLLALSSSAVARPGGGESFGGGFSGGGGGDVDIGLLIDLIILCIHYPALGAVVIAALIIFALVKRFTGSGLPDWSAGVPAKQVKRSTNHGVARRALNRIRQQDPMFSIVLFEDFLYTLYAELQRARARNQAARLAAYLSPNVQGSLSGSGIDAVNGVVIGAMRYLGMKTQNGQFELTVEFESNLTEVRGPTTTRWYAIDRLIVTRSTEAKSRPPARARTLDCANCGAPIEALRGSTCSYCQQDVGGGRFDWMVRSIRRMKSETQPPLLTGNVEERGNELPTIVANDAESNFAQLVVQDPALDRDALWARVTLIFNELQVGWSQQQLLRIRGYVSDNLFQFFGYWFDLYQQAGARNVSENARIVQIALSSVISDAHFDAVTLRVFAIGLDYTIDNRGKLLKGSKTKERAYTEYWTLIRGRAARGRPRTDPSCPSCGAPMNVNMAGHCNYCRAKVVTGDFDWVLSRIEQDETYGG